MTMKVSELDAPLSTLLTQAGIDPELEVEDSLNTVLKGDAQTCHSLITAVKSFKKQDERKAAFKALYAAVLHKQIAACQNLPADFKRELLVAMSNANLLDRAQDFPMLNEPQKAKKADYLLKDLASHLGTLFSDPSISRETVKAHLELLGLKDQVIDQVIENSIGKKEQFMSLCEGRKNPGLKTYVEGSGKAKLDACLQGLSPQKVTLLVRLFNTATSLEAFNRGLSALKIEKDALMGGGDDSLLERIAKENRIEKAFLNTQVAHQCRLAGRIAQMDAAAAAAPDYQASIKTAVAPYNTAENSAAIDYQHGQFNFAATDAQACDQQHQRIQHLVDAHFARRPATPKLQKRVLRALMRSAPLANGELEAAKVQALMKALDDVAPAVAAGLVQSYDDFLISLGNALNDPDSASPFTPKLLRQIAPKKTYEALCTSSLEAELVAGRDGTVKFKKGILKAWAQHFSGFKTPVAYKDRDAARQALSDKKQWATQDGIFFKNKVDFKGYLDNMKELAYAHLTSGHAILARNASKVTGYYDEVKAFVDQHAGYIDAELKNLQALRASLLQQADFLKKAYKTVHKDDKAELEGLLLAMQSRNAHYGKRIAQLKVLNNDMNSLKAIVEQYHRPVILDEDDDPILLPPTIAKHVVSSKVVMEDGKDAYTSVATQAYEASGGDDEALSSAAESAKTSNDMDLALPYEKGTNEEIICSSAYRFSQDFTYSNGQSVSAGTPDGSVFAVARIKQRDLRVRSVRIPDEPINKMKHMLEHSRAVLLNEEYEKTDEQGYQPVKYINIRPGRTNGQVTERNIEDAAVLYAAYIAQGVAPSKISVPRAVQAAAEQYGFVDQFLQNSELTLKFELSESPGVVNEVLRVRMGATEEDEAAADYIVGDHKPDMIVPK